MYVRKKNSKLLRLKTEEAERLAAVAAAAAANGEQSQISTHTPKPTLSEVEFGSRAAASS